jgi:hypothetical protein
MRCTKFTSLNLSPRSEGIHFSCEIFPHYAPCPCSLSLRFNETHHTFHCSKIFPKPFPSTSPPKWTKERSCAPILCVGAIKFPARVIPCWNFLLLLQAALLWHATRSVGKMARRRLAWKERWRQRQFYNTISVSPRGCGRSTLEPVLLSERRTARERDVFFWLGHRTESLAAAERILFSTCVLAQEIEITTMGTSCRWKARSSFEMCRKEIYWQRRGQLIIQHFFCACWTVCVCMPACLDSLFLDVQVHEMKIMMLREAEGVAGLCSQGVVFRFGRMRHWCRDSY